VKTLVALVAACALVGGATGARADPTDAWTAPARVAKAIGPCTQVGDLSMPSKATSCTTTYTDACENATGSSTLSIEMCTEAAVTYWNGVIAQRVHALRAYHLTAVDAFVQTSDAAWQRYRSVRCGMYRDFEGTLSGIQAGLCQLETTIQRADDLREYGGHVTAKGVD
jgi:uncharacterized protein YecT (DUF1311 family)